MASITQLFDDLCEALLPPAKALLGQRSLSRRRAKQSLKRVAYNALFTNLFQDETPKLQPDLSRLPVKNKILMLSFDLRVGGLGPKADRLEELVGQLEAAPCCPPVEVGSALDLLGQLAGTGPPQVLPRKRDYFLNNKHVGRNVPYSGYDCYDLSVFEMDVQSLISREEYLCQDMIQKALQVMEATPGTGLPTARLFSYGDPYGDRFETPGSRSSEPFSIPHRTRGGLERNCSHSLTTEGTEPCHQREHGGQSSPAKLPTRPPPGCHV